MATMEQISVLLVDDEALWLESLSEDLEGFGFAIAGTASTFDEALAVMSTVPFDIALVDINIQGQESGIELGKRLYTRYKKPYLFVTGNADRQVVERAIAAQPSGYLVKPSHPASLYASIHAAVQNFQAGHSPATTDLDTTNTSFFFVRVGNKLQRISWKDVVYLRAERNYTEFFCAVHQSSYCIRSTLLRTLTCMVPIPMRGQFVQVNRSEAVNTAFATNLRKSELVTPFARLTVTDAYLKDLKQKLNIIA